MKYVKKVKSTLKQGVDVELSPRTVIVGPNGAGKTSIVQTMELATCGWAGDMEGRDRVKIHGALARLFPEDQPMVCEVWLDDDTHFEWRMKRDKEGNLKKPDHNPPVRVEWPIQDLMSVLGSDNDTVKSWLEEQVIGGLKESDILGAVDKAVQPVVKKLMSETGERDFLALAQSAKKKAKTLRSNATKQENTVNKMVQGVPAPLLDSERQDLEKQLEDLRAQDGVSEQAHAQLKEGIDRGVARIQKLDEEIEALKVLDPEAQARVITLKNLEHLVSFHIEHFGHEECFVCGSQTPDIEKRKQTVEQVKAALKPAVDAHLKRVELEATREGVFSNTKRLADEYKAQKVKPDTSALEDALVSKLARDTAARNTWRNAEAARLEISDARTDAENLNKAAESLATYGKDLLDRKKAAFVEEVSNYLPEGDTLGVDLDAARVGLVRGKELHSALSGSEWSRVLLALGSAETTNGVPRILVPEDRSWDKSMLERVMKALSNCPSQVVIMSTTAPDPVEGWTMIDLR